MSDCSVAPQFQPYLLRVASIQRPSRAAYDAFLKKWSTLCPAVATSLEEAGLELLTFYDFPKATWKSIRTTNILENLNREFRRRTKTQASFGTEDAALTLLYGMEPSFISERARRNVSTVFTMVVDERLLLP